MVKLTLSDLTTLENQAAAIAAINANSALIETALENTLSRDGTSPNAMAADLDMDGNDILNAVVASAVGPPPGLRMVWESATTDADQGAGKAWANNATLSSATVLYLDDVTRDAVSVNDLVDSFDDSTATIRGTITVSQNLDPANFVTFNVTGAVTSASTYSKIAVTYVASGGTLADADNVAVQFVRTGNDGAGAGDVSGPASATADAIALFNGTGGKTIKDSTYTITAAGAALLDDAAASNQRTTLGLGTAAIVNTGVANGNVPLVGTKSATTTLAGMVEQSTSAENITGTDDTVFPSVAGTKEMIDTHASGGIVLQAISMSIAEATGTTSIPADDTSPLSTEGTQLGTQAITLADNSNKVLIVGAVQVTLLDTNVYLTVALFRGTTCISARIFEADLAEAATSLAFAVLDSPITAGSVTYSARIGGNTAGQAWQVGQAGSSNFGGVAVDGLILMEISA